MRRYYLRLVWAITCGVALPTLVQAQDPKTKADAGKAPPPRAITVVDSCPYRAATPYNATIVHRPVPNPSLNMPNYTLSCDVPNQNLQPYVAPPCEFGCGWNRCGWGLGGCGWGLGGCGNHGSNACGACGSTTNCTTCENSCDNSCGSRGYAGWLRFGCGNNGCGCSTGCTGNAAPAPTTLPAVPAAAPANIKPVTNIEKVGFWSCKKPQSQSPANDCLACPPHGPKPKHTLPNVSSLGCTGCGTFESEAVFIFGSCRQFFGEPTHRWLHGK